MKLLENLLLVVLGGFTAVFLFLSKDYSSTAALFPRIIAIASLVFLAGIWGRRAISEVQETGLRPQILAVQAAYIVFIYLIGFVAATVAFLLVAPIQMHYKRWGVVAAHAVVLTLVLSVSFMWLFSVQLPSGALWDLW